MEKQYIFFDLDGTLTDSMLGITKAVQYALRRYGIEVEDRSVLRPFVGPPLAASFREYYHFSETDAQDAVYVFREYYNVIGWKENAPFEGVEGMLKTLRESKKTLYVATSKPEEMARQVLDYFDMAKYFAFIGGAETDGRREKKVDVIRYVMERNGLTRPDEIVMVGDRYHDMEGARQAGVDSVGVLYGYGTREELEQAEAVWITDTVEDLTELLKRL